MTLQQFIDAIASLCLPEHIHLCDGSLEEYDQIAQAMEKTGSLVALNPEKRPHSFWCHSHPDDVARVEENTFICSRKKEDSGPTNNWKDPVEMHQHLQTLFKGCMRGRTMYVIPYCMGPIHSPFARFGVELTDSPYVVLNMRIMTRMGKEITQKLTTTPFVRGVHSVGVPLEKNEKDAPWPCNPKNRWIVHFPEEKAIWSFGSGYGGNALLGKKCFALRIASAMGKKGGWFAEHMLLLGITNPAGEKKYFAAAFPSACGKTNLAMLRSTLPGWKVECVGDDIAWIHLGQDGRLYAINPEAGYFGVAPGTSEQTNPIIMETIRRDTLFTNVGYTADGDVWWEGIGTKPKHPVTSWLGTRWDPAAGTLAAHPNARFTVAAKQNPLYDNAAENPHGVPLSAIIFGGRRSSVVPLVSEAFDWQHGVFYGASISSETTAASKGEVGKLRHDPFAMLPFCGYHMGDYFAHWLDLARRATAQNLPRIYFVNWFQKDAHNHFLWPGFQENIRVLEWIFNRTDNRAEGIATPIGYLPKTLNLSGLTNIPLQRLLHVDRAAYLKECDALEAYFVTFGNRFPQELYAELHKMRARLL